MTARLDDLTPTGRLARLGELADALVETVAESKAPLYLFETVRVASEKAKAHGDDVKVGLGHARQKGLIVIEGGLATLGAAARDLRSGKVEDVPPATPTELQSMATTWHAGSDHAADGAEFGSFTCNCERVAARAHTLGWRPAA
jgi:hypothetical protein